MQVYEVCDLLTGLPTEHLNLRDDVVVKGRLIASAFITASESIGFDAWISDVHAPGEQSGLKILDAGFVDRLHHHDVPMITGGRYVYNELCIAACELHIEPGTIKPVSIKSVRSVLIGSAREGCWFFGDFENDRYILTEDIRDLVSVTPLELMSNLDFCPEEQTNEARE
jgi:hypothetical protein